MKSGDEAQFEAMAIDGLQSSDHHDLLNIIDRDGDVAESAAGVGVATCVALEGWIGLRAVIVGQLEDTSIRILYLVSVGHA